MDLRSGVDVFDSSGEKVGTVGDVFSGEPVESSGPTAGSNAPLAPSAPTTDESGAASSGFSSTGAPATGMPYQGADRGAAAGDGPGGGMGGGLGPVPVPAAERTEVGASGDESGIPLTPSDTKFFEVKSGGLLGIGGHTWYVPFSAVAEAGPEAVTLSCTRDECADLYSNRPASLAEELPSR